MEMSASIEILKLSEFLWIRGKMTHIYFRVMIFIILFYDPVDTSYRLVGSFQTIFSAGRKAYCHYEIHSREVSFLKRQDILKGGTIMQKKDTSLLIITGMSGAGKTVAVRSFED